MTGRCISQYLKRSVLAISALLIASCGGDKSAPPAGNVSNSEITTTPTPEIIVTPDPEYTVTPTPEITRIPTPEVTSSPTPEITNTPTPEVPTTPDPAPTETDNNFPYLKVSSANLEFGAELPVMNRTCIQEFGSDSRTTDWFELETYYDSGADLAELVELSGLTSSTAWVKVGDTINFSDNRGYFVAFHNHSRPPNFLAHENIDNYYLSLGSWSGIRQVLCTTSPIELAPTIEPTTAPTPTPTPTPTFEPTITPVPTSEPINNKNALVTPNGALIVDTSNHGYFSLDANFSSTSQAREWVVFALLDNHPNSPYQTDPAILQKFYIDGNSYRQVHSWARYADLHEGLYSFTPCWYVLDTWDAEYNAEELAWSCREDLSIELLVKNEKVNLDIKPNIYDGTESGLDGEIVSNFSIQNVSAFNYSSGITAQFFINYNDSFINYQREPDHVAQSQTLNIEDKWAASYIFDPLGPGKYYLGLCFWHTNFQTSEDKICTGSTKILNYGEFIENSSPVRVSEINLDPGAVVLSKETHVINDTLEYFSFTYDTFTGLTIYYDDNDNEVFREFDMRFVREDTRQLQNTVVGTQSIVTHNELADTLAAAYQVSTSATGTIIEGFNDGTLQAVSDSIDGWVSLPEDVWGGIVSIGTIGGRYLSAFVYNLDNATQEELWGHSYDLEFASNLAQEQWSSITATVSQSKELINELITNREELLLLLEQYTGRTTQYWGGYMDGYASELIAETGIQSVALKSGTVISARLAIRGQRLKKITQIGQLSYEIERYAYDHGISINISDMLNSWRSNGLSDYDSSIYLKQINSAFENSWVEDSFDTTEMAQHINDINELALKGKLSYSAIARQEIKDGSVISSSYVNGKFTGFMLRDEVTGIYYLDYVLVNGRIVTGNKHVYISDGGPVRYAGKIVFNDDLTEVRFFDNSSGHFQPDPTDIKGIYEVEKAFKSQYGYDISGKFTNH